jgi:hypothetical protein
VDVAVDGVWTLRFCYPSVVVVIIIIIIIISNSSVAAIVLVSTVTFIVPE